MTLKKPGKVLNLLHLWKIKVLTIHQRQSFMKEILLQIILKLLQSPNFKASH